VSPSPVKVLLEVVSVLLLARIIEPIYGSTEFLKLVLLVDFFPCLMTFIMAYCVFLAAPGRLANVLYTRFSGFHGVIAGLLVAVKQIMPDQEVKIFGAVKLRARYFPSVFLLISTALAAGIGAWADVPFLVFGTYVSWLYLRFFQQQPETTLKGDPSEDFQFASFFPDALHGPVGGVSRVCSLIFRLKHSSPTAEQRSLLPISQPALGSDSADANRRRERGAKALQERLNPGRTAGSPTLAPSQAINAEAQEDVELPASSHANH